MHQLTNRSIQTVTAGTPESNADNIKSCLARGLPEFAPTPCIHDGTFVIVGSGPSLPKMAEEIREQQKLGRPICAIKGAHDFLMEQGIEPDLFVSVEPRERPLKYLSDKTCYMLASRVAPSLFDQLKDKNILVWHSFSSNTNHPPKMVDGKPLHWKDFNPLPECEVWRGRFGIGGASTSGLRAFNIAYLMGFRKIILFGMDSCLAEDKYTKRFSGENIGDSKVIDVILPGSGKRFFCNGALASQAMEFQEVIGMFKDLKVKVRGGGLLAAIMEDRAMKGYDR
jgi:hypothetical protein